MSASGRVFSISISTNILKEADRTIAHRGSGSARVEELLWEHVRREIGTRDMALINANAEQLNREMEDVLRFQADLFENEAKTQ